MVSDPKQTKPVIWSDQLKEQMAKDPEIAAAIRDFTAAVHQAQAGVESGQYQTLDEGIAAITGATVEPFDPDEEDDEDDEG